MRYVVVYRPSAAPPRMAALLQMLHQLTLSRYER